MRLRHSIFLVLGLLSVSAGVRAADDEMDSASYLADSDRIEIESKKWELGLQFGYAKAIGDKSASVLANNSVFLISDPGALGEDEFGENGLPAPDYTAQTLISGNRDHSYWVGAHLYYHLTSFLSVGSEASYTVQDQIDITAAGPFGYRIYDTRYRTHGVQEVAAVRLGGWMGGVRPYVMAGFGPYFYTQSVTSQLNDPDDPDHPPVQAADLTRIFGSVLYGGGLDVKFLREGSVGVAVQFQQAYMPGKDLMYVIPSARFAYHF